MRSEGAINTRSTTTYGVGRDDNDWSSRHVRIRFEMVLGAIMFYLLANHGIDSVNFPFLKLPKDFNEPLLIWGAFAFSLFSIISFLLRSQYERDLWPKQDLITKKEITKFENDFQELQSLKTGVVINEDDDTNFLHELFGKSEAIRNYSHLIGTFMQTLNRLHEENGVNSPVHPKFWSKIVASFSSINDSSETLSTRASSLKFEHGAFHSGSYAIDAVAENYRHNQEKLLVELDKISDDLNERVKALRKHSKVRWIQTNVLSVVLPTLLALALVALGLAAIVC